MPTLTTLRRLPALAAAALVLAGCAKDPELRLTAPAGSADFMARYVALGNSITAGYQSGGIAEATQRVAYPALIARAANVPYTAAYLTGVGCAPYSDFLTALSGAAGAGGVRVPPPGQLACSRAASAAGVVLLNNVAVPGANSADPTGAAGNGANPLTSLILGGRTQVERAVALDPTFISIWIGNNDVLGAVLRGDTTTATPLATFQQRYDAMLAGLANTPATRNQRGLLVGVVDATNVPAVFPASAIVNNLLGYRTLIEQGFLGGRPLQLVNCPPTTTTLVSLALILQTAQAAAALPAGQPVPFACSPTPVSPTLTLGTAGVLDAAEQAALRGRVTAINAYIQQQATRLGWVYYDPNALLLRYKQTGTAITPLPVLAGAQAVTAPFGTAVSLDGIHPSSSAHVDIAREMVAAINAKYGSTIPAPTAGPVM